MLIYKIVICPIMIYGIKAAALTKANREKLSRYERYLLSIMTRFATKKSFTRFNRRKILEGKTIEKKVVAYRIRHWAHILRRPPNHLLQQALSLRAPYKKRGRPCFTWNTSLEHDFLQTRIERSQWSSLVQSRYDIKNMTDMYLRRDETDSDSADSNDSESLPDFDRTR